jgi:hypothetical protein
MSEPDPETIGALDPEEVPTLPDDADPADVLDQLREVPDPDEDDVVEGEDEVVEEEVVDDPASTAAPDPFDQPDM